jgi:hypothetical protein
MVELTTIEVKRRSNSAARNQSMNAGKAQYGSLKQEMRRPGRWIVLRSEGSHAKN